MAPAPVGTLAGSHKHQACPLLGAFHLLFALPFPVPRVAGSLSVLRPLLTRSLLRDPSRPFYLKECAPPPPLTLFSLLLNSTYYYQGFMDLFSD